MLSVSLERRSMWEQTHVEYVAIGHCCDVPCVVEEWMPQQWWSSWWGVFIEWGINVKAVCQGHPQVWTLHSFIGRLQDDQLISLNTLSSPPCHLSSGLNYQIGLSSIVNLPFFKTKNLTMFQRFLAGDSQNVWSHALPSKRTAFFTFWKDSVNAIKT